MMPYEASWYFLTPRPCYLPDFGEGGRAKRGRVGRARKVKQGNENPTPPLPEDGEGK